MSARLIDERTNGVYVISPTPFDEDGDLDLESVGRLVDFYLGKEVDGFTILGILGEATKLTPEESRQFLERYLQQVDGAKPVIVGVSNPGTDNLVSFSQAAMDAGAAGIMIAPIPGLKTEEQAYAYFENILSRLEGIPVCYQDYPQTTGVSVSVETLNRLIDAFPNLVMLKHEESPGLTKISRLRERSDKGKGRRISILVGNGGLHLPQELRRGVDGAMTGFAYPEMLVEVCRRFFKGDKNGAEDVFDRYLPILRHEQQLGFGLAIRKEILRRRGAISTARVRHPGAVLNARDHQELDELTARLDTKLKG